MLTDWPALTGAWYPHIAIESNLARRLSGGMEPRFERAGHTLPLNPP